MTLRLIALFKLVKGLMLIVVGFGTLRLIHADVVAIAAEWADRFNVDPQNHHIEQLLNRLSAVDEHTLVSIGAGSFVYGALLLTEGVGLWLQKRWAEYFTIIVTASFIPLEAYEAFKRFTLTRLLVIAVNAAIVWYLVTQVRRYHPGSAASVPAAPRRDP